MPTNEPMSAEREADIRARRAAIPDGEYRVDELHRIPFYSIALCSPGAPERWNEVAQVSSIRQLPGERSEDRTRLAEFIAAAPADVEGLLSEVERLRTELDALLTLANGLDAALEDAGITDVIAQVRLATFRAKLPQEADDAP